MRVMEFGVRWSSTMKIGMHCSQVMSYEGRHGPRRLLLLTAM